MAISPEHESAGIARHCTVVFAWCAWRTAARCATDMAFTRLLVRYGVVC